MKRSKKFLSLALVLIMALTLLPITALAAPTRETDPNNTRDQATEMVLNTEYVGNLSDGSDVDWYSFTLTEAHMVTVTYNFIGGNPAMQMYIYDSANKELANVNLKGTDLILPKTTNSFNLPADTYYIKISDISWAGATVPFRNEDYFLTVNAAVCEPNREIEPNGSANQATVIQTNKQYIGNLNDGSDVDFYKFTLVEANMVTVTYDFKGGNPSMKMTLFDYAANRAVTIETLKGSDLILPKTTARFNLPAGTYHIEISDISWAGASAPFRNEDYYLTVNAAVCEPNREIEPNNSANQGTPIQLNAEHVGNLNDSDDVDWYKFTLAKTEKTSVGFNFKDGNPSMSLEVYDANNKKVIDISHKGADLVFPRTTEAKELVAGAYYIKIVSNHWAGASAPFRNEDYYIRVITTADAPNLDQASPWAREDLNRAYSLDLIPAGLQSVYTQATSRAEFCALAVTLYENLNGPITGRVTFNDTTDVNVEKAAFIGVVNGTSPGKFTPNTQLTREQAATMLARLANALGQPFEKKAATFTDKGNISDWALESVGQVQAAGIMNGTSPTNFTPKGPYTREQSIVTVLRTYDVVT